MLPEACWGDVRRLVWSLAADWHCRGGRPLCAWPTVAGSRSASWYRRVSHSGLSAVQPGVSELLAHTLAGGSSVWKI